MIDKKSVAKGGRVAAKALTLKWAFFFTHF
jgi:hypothetical protein